MLQFHYLIIYLADNIWSLFTANNISAYLKSQKIDLNSNVVLNYIHNITSVFLINKVKRQEVIWKKIFEINDKFYFSDLWIRNTILWWYKQVDIAKILENIVFLHFKSLGYSIFVWKNKDKEIDFIVEKWNDKKYIQVTYLMINDETKQREFGNLLEIKDNYEKIVLSLDDFILWDYLWIKHYNLIDYISWKIN